MRLPWGDLGWLISRGGKSQIALLGCLSFEERCKAVVKQLHSAGSLASKPFFLEVRDPPDAFPDYSGEAHQRIERNLRSLRGSGISLTKVRCDLLATEDQLLDLLSKWSECHSAETVVLDISSFPKRYYCFLLKRLLMDEKIKRLVVCYTEAGRRGYSPEHLCDDPMPCDHLPGFSASIPPTGEWLVVAVGFETLNISSLVHVYRDATRQVKFLHSFPPGLHVNRRQWATLLEIASAGQLGDVSTRDIEVVSLWDSEQVYRRLEKWRGEWMSSQSVGGSRVSNSKACMALAPFGSKPHTLGMALFAIKNQCGMYYTQPKSYHPDYASGYGQSWSYIVKWEGVPCFDRDVTKP